MKTSIGKYLDKKKERSGKEDEIFLRADFGFSEDDFDKKPLYVADIILIITALCSKDDHYMTVISEMDSVYQELWSEIFASYLAIPSERSQQEDNGDKDDNDKDKHNAIGNKDGEDGESTIKQLLDDITRLKNKIETMTKDNSELQGIITDYEENNHKHQEAMKRLNDIIRVLENKNSELTTQKIVLEHKIESQAQTISDFEKKMSEHQEKNAQLKEQYITDLGYLRMNSDNLREQGIINEKDDKISMLQIRITQLERERETQTQKRSFIEIDNTQQSNIIISLNKENAKLKEIINQNIEEIKKEKWELEEYSQLVESLQKMNSHQGDKDKDDKQKETTNDDDALSKLKLKVKTQEMTIAKMISLSFIGIEKTVEVNQAEIMVDNEQTKLKENEGNELTQSSKVDMMELNQKTNEILKLKEKIQIHLKKTHSLSLENKALLEANSTMTQQINQLSTDIKALREAKILMQTEIDALKNNNNSNTDLNAIKDNETIKQNEERIVQLQKEIEIKDTELNKHQKDKNKLKKEIADKDKEILELKDEVNKLKKGIEYIDKEYMLEKEAKTKLENQLDINSQELQKQKEECLKLQNEIEINHQDNEPLTPINTYKEKTQQEDKLIQVNNLVDELESKDTMISDLQTKALESKSVIEKLNKDMTDLTSKNNQLLINIKAIETQLQKYKRKKPNQIVQQQKQLFIKALYDKAQIDAKMVELSSLKSLLNSFSNSSNVSSKEKLSTLVSVAKKNEEIVNNHIQQNNQLKTELETVTKSKFALSNLMQKYFSISKSNPSAIEEQFKQIKAHISKSQTVISENIRLNTMVKTLNNQLAKSQLQQSKQKEEIDKLNKEATIVKDKEMVALKNENLTLKKIMIEMKNKANSEYDLVTQSLSSLVGQFNQLKSEIGNSNKDNDVEIDKESFQN